MMIYHGITPSSETGTNVMRKQYKDMLAEYIEVNSSKV